MSDLIVNRLALVLAAALAACTCPPTEHVESTYAPPAMSDSIQLCVTERACTVLCARAFYLDAGSIDSCRILEMDQHGGAYVEVTWTEYVCQFEEWSTDDGDYSGDDYGSDDDYDPCSDGSCDPGGGDDEVPPPEDPPDEDPPPDDDPPMDEGV